MRLLRKIKDWIWKKDLLPEKDWYKVIEDIESEEEWEDE